MAEVESKLSNPEAYSFSTELFGSLEAVRRKNAETIRVCEEVAAMIRARATADEEYSRSLKRIANQSSMLNTLGGGGDIESSFKESVLAFRADLLNKSVQHTQFASALLAEVCEPVQQIRSQLTAQSKDLADRMAAITKSLRSYHNNYITSHQKFEKSYQATVSTACKIMDAGGTPPKIDPFLVYQKYGLDKIEQGNAAATLPSLPTTLGSAADNTNNSTSSTPPPNNLAASSIWSRLPPAPAAPSLLHSVARTDLTSWLLPTDRARLEDLLVTSRQQLEYAELTRFACRDQWEALLQHSRQVAHEIQLVLADYQMLEERQMDELKVVMRKALVFESSSLANQQYDVQMVFKQLEAIDVDRDLATFIEVHRTPFLGNDLRSLLETLCITNTPLPVPPPGFPNNNNAAPPAKEEPHEWPLLKPGQFDHEMEEPLRKVAPASLILRLLLANSSANGRFRASPAPWTITLMDNLSTSFSNAVEVSRNSLNAIPLPHPSFFPPSLSRSASTATDNPPLEQLSQPLPSPPPPSQDQGTSPPFSSSSQPSDEPPIEEQPQEEQEIEKQSLTVVPL